MKDYLITFDDNGWQKNYAGIYEAIEQLARGGVKVGTTTCVIKSPYNAVAIRNHLLNFIDPREDELFVTALAEDAAWHRPNYEQDSVHTWLKANLFAE